jgi:hypothetical protein
MAKTSEAVAECELSFQDAENEFQSLQEVVHAAQMEQNQALEHAQTTRAKQLELQKNMAVLQKAKNDLSFEIKMIERHRSHMDAIKEVQRLAQEAKDAVKAARLHKKELAWEFKEIKKRAHTEQRMEKLACSEQQKQVEHVFVKLKELEHKKQEDEERTHAKREEKLVAGKRSAINSLPVSSDAKQSKLAGSTASCVLVTEPAEAYKSTMMSSSDDRGMMRAPTEQSLLAEASLAGVCNEDSLASNTLLVSQNGYQATGDNDAQCQWQSQSLNLVL